MHLRNASIVYENTLYKFPQNIPKFNSKYTVHTLPAGEAEGGQHQHRGGGSAPSLPKGGQ